MWNPEQLTGTGGIRLITLRSSDEISLGDRWFKKIADAVCNTKTSVILEANIDLKFANGRYSCRLVSG